MLGIGMDDLEKVDIYIAWKENGSFVISSKESRIRMYGDDITELKNLDPAYGTYVLLWALQERLDCSREKIIGISLCTLALLAFGTGVVEYSRSGDVWVIRSEMDVAD